MQQEFTLEDGWEWEEDGDDRSSSDRSKKQARNENEYQVPMVSSSPAGSEFGKAAVAFLLLQFVPSLHYRYLRFRLSITRYVRIRVEQSTNTSM